MLNNDSYLQFGSNLYTMLNTSINSGQFNKIVVLCDTNTVQYCLPIFRKMVTFDFETLEIPEGERHKNVETLQKIWKKLLDLQVDRKSVFLNLGGGVVSDLGGFAASTYLRGIPFVNIPTTLLGMVDAAIGGKSGIDFLGLKNQIGVIEQPLWVGIDSDFLDTLPKRQLVSGMAEVIKYGLIHDKNLLNELLNLSELSITTEQIHRSAQIKQEIVTQDPNEKGSRKTLNFGHTFGHALESHFLNKPKHEILLHGEAVAVGMSIALHLSFQKLGLAIQRVDTVSKFLLKFYPKPNLSDQDIHNILKLMQFDKKNDKGKLQFVLLQNIAEPIWNQEVTHQELEQAIEYYRSL